MDILYRKVPCVNGGLFYDTKNCLQNGIVVLVFRGIESHRKVWGVLFLFSTWIYFNLFYARNVEVLPPLPSSFQGLTCWSCILPLSPIIALIWDVILCSNGSRILTFLFMMIRQCWNQGNTSILGFILMLICVPVVPVLLSFQTFYDMGISMLLRLMLNLWSPSVFPQENQMIYVNYLSSRQLSPFS